ncbi:hypothetical protein KBH13_06895 [Myxococcota bacterium]|nr:hypothetical protein [Myxococcota bacterium]
MKPEKMKPNKRKTQQPKPEKPSAESKSLYPWNVIAASVILIVLALFPYGPLAILPPVLRFFLVGAAVLGWFWEPISTKIGPKAAKWPAILAEVLAVLLIVGSFFLIKIPGIHASGTDDNIYFYMANAFANGQIPYKDFFFSHPPVHLLVPALIFKIFGFSLGLAKSIPVFATILAGIFMYMAARRAGRGFAMLTLLFHLTAYQVLMASSDMNGENIMTAFLAASVWATFAGRPLLAGILAGFGLGSGLYAFAGVLALTLINGRRFGRFLAGLALSFGTVMLVFFIIAPSEFIDGVFRYHVSKPVTAANRASIFNSLNPFKMFATLLGNLGAYLTGKEFGKSLYYHALFAIAFGITAVYLAANLLLKKDGDAKSNKRRAKPTQEPDPTTKFAVFGLIVTVLFLLQWAALNEIYDFYQVPMLALMAPLPAWVCWQIFKGVKEGTTVGKMGIAIGMLALMCLHLPMEYRINRWLWPSEQQNKGSVIEYQWREPVAFIGLAKVSKAVFFSPTRIKGKVTPHYRHVMWNKMLTFTTADEIAAYIKANTSKDETITGASTLAPLVALLADRRMAGDESDTNSKRFSSGNWTHAQFRELVLGDNVKYLIGAARSAFTDQAMNSNPAFKDTFVLEKTFIDEGLLHFRSHPIRLYRRADRPTSQ